MTKEKITDTVYGLCLEREKLERELTEINEAIEYWTDMWYELDKEIE